MKNDITLTSEKHRSRTKKVVAVLASLILLLTVVTGATLAYMFMNTNAVTNTFRAAEAVNPNIMETFTEHAPKKEAVRVNVGNPGYAVYVRAQVVINWTDKDSNVLAMATPVEGTDYNISYTTSSTDSNWFYCNSDGFYYYKKPVSSGETEELIDICTVEKQAPVAGYTLQVDILTQTIQVAGVTADGKPPVEEAWGVIVNSDKTISK